MRLLQAFIVNPGVDATALRSSVLGFCHPYSVVALYTTAKESQAANLVCLLTLARSGWRNRSRGCREQPYEPTRPLSHA